MMFATCLATVAALMTSSPAMARLVMPRETRAAISRSRGVSVLGGVTARPGSVTPGTGPGAGAVPGLGGYRVERERDGLIRAQRRARRPQPRYRGLAEIASGRGEVALDPRPGDGRETGRLSQRRGCRGQPDGKVGAAQGGGERGHPFQSVRHPRPRPGGLAEPKALGQVPAGHLGHALVERHPADACQAAGDFRAGVYLPQDGQRFEIAAARAAWIAAQPGQRAEPGQRPRRAPLLIDPPHDLQRRFAEALCLPQLAFGRGEAGRSAERVALVPLIGNRPADGQGFAEALARLVQASRVQVRLGEQVERRGHPHLRPGPAAQVQARLGVPRRRGRVARQHQLRARDQGRAVDGGGQAGRGPGLAFGGEETVEPLAAADESAARGPVRAQGRADPQPGFGVTAGQAAREHLLHVVLIGIAPAEHADGGRPGGRDPGHADRGRVLQVPQEVVAQPALQLRGLARGREPLGRVLANGIEQPVPGLPEQFAVHDHQRLVHQRRDQVQHVTGQQVVPGPGCPVAGADLLGHVQ